MNSLEIKDKQSQVLKRMVAIVDNAKLEMRELTEDEKVELNACKDQMHELKMQYDALQEKLDKYGKEFIDEVAEDMVENDYMVDNGPDAPKEEPMDQDTEKNKRSSKRMKKSIIKEVRNAIAQGNKSFKLQRAAGTLTVAAGTDNEGNAAKANANVVQEEYQPIIDPLYANKVITSLGVRTYTGLPMGDVTIPKLGKGTCGWASEVAKAMKSDNSLATVTLKPHRIAAYVDISNRLLAQDNIEFEAAIRRDIENALADKIEATLFGYLAAVADERPAGLFADKDLVDGTTYAKLCDLEASVEENNYTGTMKYLMSPKAKAFVRQMSKSTKNTELVLENGMLDGTEVITTSNVPAKTFIYGAFDDIAVGYWGDIDIKIDDVSQAVFGVTRLVINAYVDFKTIRDGGLVFGTTDSSLVGTKLA